MYMRDSLIEGVYRDFNFRRQVPVYIFFIVKSSGTVVINKQKDTIMIGSVKTKLDALANRRDYFQCRDCGEKHALETHHIIPELEKLYNLITLCHRCHKKRHNMSGCFGQGLSKDEKRKETQFEIGNALGFKLRGINETMYYNRHIKQWISK